MLKFSSSAVKILSSVLKQKPHIVFDSKKCRAIVKLPYNFISAASYSEDATKTKTTSVQSPLGSLLAKDAADSKADIKVKIEDDDEESKKQRESAWRTMKLTLIFFGISFVCLGGYLIIILGAPEKDDYGRVMRDDLIDEPTWKQYLMRTYRELDYYRKLIKEPSRLKLLPDPVEYPYYQPKYTLVLELTDVLVHPDWTYSTGWRFKKRPGLEFLLNLLSGKFEIVVYTAEQGITVFPLIDAIDPKNQISYKLVRDATLFSGGHHIKALDNLNRDLSKVIVVDWNPNSVKLHPENLFKIKRWDGSDTDSSLIDLAMFLKIISDNDIDDVREVLEHYKDYEDPILAFKEKQKAYFDLLAAEAEAQREVEAKPKRWIPSFLRK